MTTQQLEATRAMLTWLRAAGAEGLDNVEVKETAYGGLGVFLAAPVETTIARIPVECCVTAAAALTRPGGRAAREVLPDCADEFVLVLDAATGRRDATHPQHGADAASSPCNCQHSPSIPSMPVASSESGTTPAPHVSRGAPRQLQPSSCTRACG